MLALLFWTTLKFLINVSKIHFYILVSKEENIYVALTSKKAVTDC